MVLMRAAGRLVGAGVLVLGIGILSAAAVSAQDAPPLPGELVIGDLDTPRGIAFGEDGTLYVTVTGSGGPTEATMMSPTGEEMTAQIGLTGQVLGVAADGTSTPVVDHQPSYGTPNENTGLYRAIPNGSSLWLVVTGGPPGAYWADSIVELDMSTPAMTPLTIISLSAFEAANNPDGNEIDSNVADIAWTADGTMLIADAGANALLSWTAEDGLAVVATWPDNSVPTSVEVAEDGSVYVGFLGAGVAPGAGKIEVWSNGELTQTFGGLTGVTDILLDGDNLYATELFLMGDQGPGPGDVVQVTADGNTVVAGGLVTPFGLAMDADGNLYVSFGTVAFTPGQLGGVVRVSLDS